MESPTLSIPLPEEMRPKMAFAGMLPQLPAVSLVGMKTQAEVADYLSQVGEEARFELSYKMSASFLGEIEALVRGKVLSAHACCPSTEYFPNFGSSDPAVIEQSFINMRSTLDTAIRFGASVVVLHPGYVTDSAMSSDYRLRSVLLARPEFGAEVRFAEGSICGPDYNRTDGYQRFASRAKRYLVELAAIYSEKGIRLAAENLNPRVGYLFHSPAEMAELAGLHPNLYLCLDLGHLRISSFAYGFDFLEGVRTIVATGKVATCHLHSNSSSPGHFRDDHHSIDSHGFPLKEVLGILASSEANLVLETVEEPIHNTRLLKALLAGQ